MFAMDAADVGDAGDASAMGAPNCAGRRYKNRPKTFRHIRKSFAPQHGKVLSMVGGAWLDGMGQTASYLKVPLFGPATSNGRTSLVLVRVMTTIMVLMSCNRHDENPVRIPSILMMVIIQLQIGDRFRAGSLLLPYARYPGMSSLLKSVS